MKGFKSFPERVSLEFSPGVSVIVGPNGSGKSNITDAVLWALGEQSPGAIRGASMQDVISAGGKGVGQRRSAEVEVVIDNSDGRAATEFSEIAVERRLDRDRKSTRLNSSYSSISYAVFCLKKKKKRVAVLITVDLELLHLTDLRFVLYHRVNEHTRFNCSHRCKT